MQLVLLLLLVGYGTARLVHAALTGVVPTKFSVVREDDQPIWFTFNLAVLAVAVGLGWMLAITELGHSHVSVTLSS